MALLLCSGSAVLVLGVLLTLGIHVELRAPLLLAEVGSPLVPTPHLPPRSVYENPIVETPEMGVGWKIKKNHLEGYGFL